MNANFGGENKIEWPPDYVDVSATRAWRLDQIRQNPEILRGAKIVYRDNPAEFIEHWVTTYDPRNAGTGHPVTMPFILFPKQREMVDFIFACLQAPAHGLIEKSRDMGATWLACAFSVWLWLFWPGAAIGWGKLLLIRRYLLLRRINRRRPRQEIDN
jgi:phage terminase large subunit